MLMFRCAARFPARICIESTDKEDSVDALVRGARKGLHKSKRSRQHLRGIFSFSSGVALTSSTYRQVSNVLYPYSNMRILALQSLLRAHNLSTTFAP